jgi:uncharacterized protein (TIGR02284 family)
MKRGEIDLSRFLEMPVDSWSMEPEDDTQAALKLQVVLTRYVDSEHGYKEASGLVESQSMAQIFLEISGSRARIVPQIAALLTTLGHEPDEEGSIEGAVHRWWMVVKDKLTQDEVRDVLTECIRGESALLKAIDIALEAEQLPSDQKEVLHLARLDVEKAISHFNAAVNDGEFE